MSRTVRLVILMLVGALAGSLSLGAEAVRFFSTTYRIRDGDPVMELYGAMVGVIVGASVECGWRLAESRFRFGLSDWLLFSACAAIGLAVILLAGRFAFTW